MADYHIRDACSIKINKESNDFVGIRVEGNDMQICFPLGFEASFDNRLLRNEILLLMNAISTTTGKKDSQIDNNVEHYNETGFPVQAYLSVIYDYLKRGYYKEKENHYKINVPGKISWTRTIKTQKPYLQGGNAYYLDFVSRLSKVNENELITQIHKYCVYDSFIKLGWLFTAFIPEKPIIKFNKRQFAAVIKEKLHNTFNDKNRSLFRNMLAIINAEVDGDADKKLTYGTYNFEYVWEQMIDRVYGVVNKSDYYPLTTWVINEKHFHNSVLKPDTIMIWNDNVYILDAKYYKYGVTKKPGDLPGSSSIDKQITYGEYVAETREFRTRHGEEMKVFNAFLMPYIGDCPKRIGEGVSNWKGNDKTYERVQGILIDTKTLIEQAHRHDQSNIKELADLISQYADRHLGE